MDPRRPVVTSTGNAAVKAARRLAGQRRGGGDGVLVEGPQAVREALDHLERLFVAPRAFDAQARLVRRAQGRGVEVIAVSDAVLGSIAGTVTPQGLIGVATLAGHALDDVLPVAGLVLAVAGLADPGNAGTILRTADAAGADAVVLTAGSVDVRNPKAVRASAGSLFHLPVVVGAAVDELVDGCRRHGLRLVAADARGDVAHTAVDLRPPTALLFGGEASGLAEGLRERCDAVVRVPMHSRPRPGFTGRPESLNVAAAVAVVAFEAARQRRDPS